MTTKERKTKETDIKLTLSIDGNGNHNIDSGIGFLDHMLETLSKHSGIDLDLKCKGDIHIDYHHTVEDIGIVLGLALYDEIFPIKNVERFSNAVAILDEAAVECDLDLGGRPYLVYELPIDGAIKDFDMELFEEFFKSLIFNSKIACHLVLKRGRNKHHIIESAFKSFAVALRRALAYRNDEIPSTKGVL